MAYFLGLGLLGYGSQYGSMLAAIGWQILFIVLVGILFSITSARDTLFPPTPSPNRLNLLVFVGIALSFIGIACLLTDKIALGIDYTKDMCSARYQMADLAQGRIGIRSIYSFFGNLLSTSFFVPVVAVITQNTTRKLFYTTLICAFACLLVFSFLASSRTSIMLFGAFSLASICLRLWSGRGMPKLVGKDVFFVAGMIFIAALFVGQVFACRAQNSNLTTTQYEEEFIDFLGAANKKAHVKPREMKTLPGKTIQGVIGMTTLYFVHSAYIFSGILSLQERPGHALFTYGQDLLEKVGLAQHDDKELIWTFAGKFPSLPGGLYYDYGAAGLIFGASILGLLAGLTGRRWMRSSANIVLTGATTSVYVVIFLSPLLFAGDVMTFPFICFAFLSVPAITCVASKIGKLLFVGKI